MISKKGANIIESGYNSKFWELPQCTNIVEATLKTNHWNQEEFRQFTTAYTYRRL